MLQLDYDRVILCVTVRLSGDQGDSAGMVEVYQTGEWKTICGDSWNKRNAGVVCRQLGYGELTLNHNRNSTLKSSGGWRISYRGCLPYRHGCICFFNFYVKTKELGPLRGRAG